jgi:TnpA family transposase
MRTDEIYADVTAISVVLNALVNVNTRYFVSVQLIAHITRARETSFAIYAVLLATVIQIEKITE